MRSARRITLALCAPAAAAGLAGCVTTQEKNSWLLLRNARELAAESAVHVSSENPGVRVRRIEIIRGRGRGSDAIVVSLANRGSRPLTDLPISVGVVPHRGSRVYLNGRANVDYYDTHVPAVPAHGSTSWVLPALRAVPTGRVFALVGVAHRPASTTVQTLPRITTTQLTGSSVGKLQVRLSNDSSLPQYGLQVYAVALRHGTAVGAGRAAVGELSGSGATTVGLTLAGRSAGAQLQLYASPTIFK